MSTVLKTFSFLALSLFLDHFFDANVSWHRHILSHLVLARCLSAFSFSAILLLLGFNSVKNFSSLLFLDVLDRFLMSIVNKFLMSTTVMALEKVNHLRVFIILTPCLLSYFRI